MDSIAEIIGFRPSQFMAQKGEALDGSPAFDEGFHIGLAQLPQPFDDRRVSILFLVKDNVARRHKGVNFLYRIFAIKNQDKVYGIKRWLPRQNTGTKVPSGVICF